MQLHQIPMIKSFDIIGYDFNASTYCDGVCVLVAMGAVAKDVADAVTYITDVTLLFGEAGTVEGALDYLADRRGINRYDERTFDQSEFPKIVFGHAEYPDYCPRCAGCGGVLDGFDPADYTTDDESEI